MTTSEETLHYDAETDSLCIDLNGRVGTDTQEVADGLASDTPFTP